MPFPTWRMPAKSWLTTLLCSVTILSFVGCNSPYSRGPFGGQGYPYGAPPPGSYPYNGGTVQPGGGSSLGTPTPVGGGNAPPFNSSDGTNKGNQNGNFGNDSFPMDDKGFNSGSSSKGGSNNDGFGRDNTFRDNSFRQEKPVPDYPDVDEFKEPIEGPSAKDDFDLESPFGEEARRQKDTKFDATPKIDPSDPLDEFNGDQFKKNDTPFKNDEPFKEDKSDSFDDKDMFDSNSQLDSPVPLKPASSSRELGKKEEAAIDRFIKDSVSARPNPYAYDKKNYKWLRGVVDYDQRSGMWSIIYDTKPDKKDSYGGSMTLIKSPILANLHDHDIILVEGEIDKTVETDRLGKPRFRVKRLFGPLIPKKSRPPLNAPVAN